MRSQFLNGLIATLLLTMVSWLEPIAEAAPVIDEIVAPIVGVTYNGTDFSISGRPASDVQVLYNDGRDPNPELYDFTVFSLSSSGLDGVISSVNAPGDHIDYTSSGTFGNISLLNGNTGFSPLLVGDLQALSLEIVNPGLGLFEGSGDFLVTGGTLADDFEEVGGLATIGISFVVPNSFNDPFAALANTKLFPNYVAPVPEPSLAAVTSVGLLSLGLMVWRRKKDS